jgi:hydrogenase/urease accessory protein HupE
MTRPQWWTAVLALVLLLVPALVQAHESRPAYLELKEMDPGQFSVSWRTPVLAGVRLPVALQLPAGAKNLREPSVQELTDSLLEHRTIDAGPGGLAGKRIEFPGLQFTITDVLVRIQLADGTSTTTLVHPSQPYVEVATSRGRVGVAGAFVMHGIEHIFGGYDHLLFVLGLLLIVRSIRVLVWTITAFTVAHSITLALATLGVVHVPGPPVEASIALSIMLVATEIVRMRRGEPSLTARWPWAISFCFGLLHGFGFAGALSEIGLPQGDIPLALFAFNVGVEAGQLAFIGVVLATLWVARQTLITARLERQALIIAPYVIGSLASFWFLQRVSEFWS